MYLLFLLFLSLLINKDESNNDSMSGPGIHRINGEKSYPTRISCEVAGDKHIGK